MKFDQVSEFRFDAAEDARIALVTSKPRPSFRSFEIRRNIVLNNYFSGLQLFPTTILPHGALLGSLPS